MDCTGPFKLCHKYMQTSHRVSDSFSVDVPTALKDAKFAAKFKLSMDYKVITSADMLKWHCVKGKAPVPCMICPNPEEALAGWEDVVKVTTRNNTVIRFLGNQYAHHGKLQAVPLSQLCACHDGNDEANTKKWSVAKMQAHLKSIGKQKEFSDSDKQLKLRTEELFLQSILDAALLLRTDETVPETTQESDDDDEYDAKVAFDRAQQSPLVKPAKVAKEAESAPSVQVYANQKKGKRILRAGDKVEY
jgi:hypothetical protein